MHGWLVTRHTRRGSTPAVYVAGANDCCEKSACKPIIPGVQDLRLTLPHVDGVSANGLSHSCDITHSHVIYIIMQ